MNKEEAIKYLQQLYPNGGHCWLDEQRIEAISMAINALQEEPVSNAVLDTVDRKAKKIWDEINTGHEYSIIESYNQFYGICMEIAEMVKKEPVSIWHDGCEIPKSETNILMIRKNEKDSNYPPIAGCFHGAKFRRDGTKWCYYNGFCYNEIEPPVRWTYIDDIK